MAEGSWNPLSSFQEMGTLSKVLLLLGFAFLGTVLARGASFSDQMLPASLAFIFLSLAVHYFSECRQTVSYDDESTTVTDWGKVATGTAMTLITAGLILWALLVPNHKVAVAPATASKDVSSPSDVPDNPAVEKDAPTAGMQVPTKKSKGPARKHGASGDGPQALGDKSAAVGPVTQGPCSILQNGGSGNTASTDCGPLSRHLLDQTKNELVDCLKKKPGRFTIGALGGNSEAYKFAQDWLEVFKSAGWQNESKDIPIQIFMIGGGMWSGMQITVHDASTTQGQIALADGSPEQNFSQCVVGKKDLSGGSLIPRKEFPAGSVRLDVSDQPQK
jgi:hypothetical protein